MRTFLCLLHSASADSRILDRAGAISSLRSIILRSTSLEPKLRYELEDGLDIARNDTGSAIPSLEDVLPFGNLARESQGTHEYSIQLSGDAALLSDASNYCFSPLRNTRNVLLATFEQGTLNLSFYRPRDSPTRSLDSGKEHSLLHDNALQVLWRGTVGSNTNKEVILDLQCSGVKVIEGLGPRYQVSVIQKSGSASLLEVHVYKQNSMIGANVTERRVYENTDSNYSNLDSSEKCVVGTEGEAFSSERNCDKKDLRTSADIGFASTKSDLVVAETMNGVNLWCTSNGAKVFYVFGDSQGYVSIRCGINPTARKRISESPITFLKQASASLFSSKSSQPATPYVIVGTKQTIGLVNTSSLDYVSTPCDFGREISIIKEIVGSSNFMIVTQPIDVTPSDEIVSVSVSGCRILWKMPVGIVRSKVFDVIFKDESTMYVITQNEIVTFNMKKNAVLGRMHTSTMGIIHKGSLMQGLPSSNADKLMWLKDVKTIGDDSTNAARLEIFDIIAFDKQQAHDRVETPSNPFHQLIDIFESLPRWLLFLVMFALVLWWNLKKLSDKEAFSTASRSTQDLLKQMDLKEKLMQRAMKARKLE